MLEQKIYIKPHTESDGIVHLDREISTGIVDRDIQLTVSYKVSPGKIAQQDDLQEISSIENFIDEVTVVELKNLLKTEVIALRKKYNLIEFANQ
ncbi:MAG: hypothetical protein AAGF83_27305 [Cyanobacteria bacterium P01_G01_bin.67]